MFPLSCRTSQENFPIGGNKGIFDLIFIYVILI